MSGNSFPFKITPVRGPRGSDVPPVIEPARRSSVEASRPPPPRDLPVEAGPAVTAGLFPTSASALSFVGAIAGARLAHEAACRRGPLGVWIEVEASETMAAELARTAGGWPYARHGTAWRRLAAFGGGGSDGVLDVSSWTSLDLADLVAGVALRPRRMVSGSVLEAVVPAGLGGWVLRRAAMLGLATQVVPATRRALVGGPASGALLVRLSAERGIVPRSLLHALTALPHTLVGLPVGADDRSLLVDVRCRIPIADALLAGMVPEGETWALGGADIGHFRLQRAEGAIDGEMLLAAPELTAIDPPPAGSVVLPPPTPLGLRPCAGAHDRVDAVLLDDIELARVKPFLAGRPAGEVAFLIPGAGKHLLTAPGGLPGLVPIGVPLFRIGPGGLYIESGMGFFPPLPERARRQVFALDERCAVALVDDGAYRFDVEQAVPAWALWVGAPPTSQDGLSRHAELLLNAVSKAIRDAERKQAEARADKADIRNAKIDRDKLLKQALREESRGNLVKAAELMEQAGHLVAAAKLYERAAQAK